ncbi:unnamed protein product, partial [Ectocarpus sp. 6 AP-2014]
MTPRNALLLMRPKRRILWRLRKPEPKKRWPGVKNRSKRERRPPLRVGRGRVFRNQPHRPMGPRRPLLKDKVTLAGVETVTPAATSAPFHSDFRKHR